MLNLAPQHRRFPYGIYTVGDDNFFAGIVAAINSLRFHGYWGPIAVLDIGFEAWMVSYLNDYANVGVLDIEPVKENQRFTDVKTDENPVMKGWAYKAFGILHYDLYDQWTFIDADYLPLCNLEAELRPLIAQGHFVSTEDGNNTWDERHADAMGVKPGDYMNINAGFISLDMKVHGSIIHEWRHLMTRKKPFDLWYGDQGALNAVLDKWEVPKYTLDKVLWNQTWLNKAMAVENQCFLRGEGKGLHVWYAPKEARIMGWHGAGWHKLWHQIGIDHYRKHAPEERLRFFFECEGQSPTAIVEIFKFFMFMGDYNQPLTRADHLLVPCP